MTVELRAAPHAVWRALTATVLILATASLAHGWAGGRLPEWPGLVLLAGVLFGGGVLFLRHRLPLRVLLLMVALAQGGLHGAFVAWEPQHHHGSAGSTASWVDSSQLSWQMVLAHAVGTMVAALVWRWCERMADVVLVAHDRPAPVPTAVRQRVRGARVGPVRRRACWVVAPRRGPPVLVGHAA